MTTQPTTTPAVSSPADFHARAAALAALGIKLTPRWTNCLSFFLSTYEAGGPSERDASLRALQEMAAAADTACALLDGLEVKATEATASRQPS